MSSLNIAMRKKPHFMVCMLVYQFISGVRDKGTKIKELALSANQSAASTLKNVVGLSQKLLNTSMDVSRVNATFQETNQLLWDSSMTSMSRSSFQLGKSASYNFDLAKRTVVPCSHTAFQKKKPQKCTNIWMCMLKKGKVLW